MALLALAQPACWVGAHAIVMPRMQDLPWRMGRGLVHGVTTRGTHASLLHATQHVKLSRSQGYAPTLKKPHTMLSLCNAGAGTDTGVGTTGMGTNTAGARAAGGAWRAATSMQRRA